MNTEIRTIIIALIAASSFAATSALPAVSQARPVQVYPTSSKAGVLSAARCGRWENKINYDKENKQKPDAAKKVKEDESKAMDDGCFIIY